MLEEYSKLKGEDDYIFYFKIKILWKFTFMEIMAEIDWQNTLKVWINFPINFKHFNESVSEIKEEKNTLKPSKSNENCNEDNLFKWLSLYKINTAANPSN